jgi:hypothetical protein
MLHSFHGPNLMSVFRRLGRLSKESVQVRSSYAYFVTYKFLTVRGCCIVLSIVVNGVISQTRNNNNKITNL